jgi:hypothetical protein
VVPEAAMTGRGENAGVCFVGGISSKESSESLPASDSVSFWERMGALGGGIRGLSGSCVDGGGAGAALGGGGAGRSMGTGGSVCCRAFSVGGSLIVGTSICDIACGSVGKGGRLSLRFEASWRRTVVLLATESSSSSSVAHSGSGEGGPDDGFSVVTIGTGGTLFCGFGDKGCDCVGAAEDEDAGSVNGK